MTDKGKGLINKYNVSRVDGKPLGDCLVMEFREQHSRVGIRAFAESVRKQGYVALADDILKKLDETAPAECQPCDKFTEDPDDPAGGLFNKHQCPLCEGWRFFCHNCFTDHHQAGWQSCNHNPAKNQFDSGYADWKVGDFIIWDLVSGRSEAESNKVQITEIDKGWERVYWNENGEQQMTRCTNMLRIRPSNPSVCPRSHPACRAK